MAADVLVNHGARASAAMVLIYRDNSLGNSSFSSWDVNLSQNINTFVVLHIEHVETKQVV